MTDQQPDTQTKPMQPEPLPDDQISVHSEEVVEPVPVLPHYVFAGSGIAGENLNVCSLCSALVKDSGIENHTAWHQNGAM